MSQTAGHILLNGAHDAINGEKGSLLAVHNGINGLSATLNGHSLHNLPSPAAESPATPVSMSAAPDIKIDMDYQEQESDVRHEPLPVKDIDYNGDPISNDPQVEIPIDPNHVSVHPHLDTPSPHSGVLLEDDKMVESSFNGTHLNGHEDIVMDDSATPGISTDFSMASLEGGATSATRSYPEDGAEHEPPAKRARLTDTDMASTAQSATPPPTSASPAPIPLSAAAAASTPHFPIGDSSFSTTQWRFCLSTIKNLKKQKDAGPFNKPVDPVALNIPHYPSIVKTPMDFSTIERKLTSSNPAKPDPNPNNPRYYSADEFIADVRLVFLNTLKFNGPEHAVTAMGKRLEELFDKQVKNIPPAEVKQVKPVVKKVTPPPPPPPPPPAKKAAPRRQSTSVPVIRRSEAEQQIGRPKREIHPPPSKDLPYSDAPRKNRKGKKVKDDGTAEQLKYCAKILQELHRKQHYPIASPFYEPVDWQKMDLPTYPKVVKKPMDLSTIRRKLENGEYEGPQNFYEDFKLMIRNCFNFNPTGTPVNLAGSDLQRLFDEKWKNLPPLRAEESDEDEDEVEDSEEDDRQRRLALLETKKAELEAEIEKLRNHPPKERKKREKKEKPPVASSSKTPKQPKAPPKKRSKRSVADDDVLTFEQKKDLSEAIGKLDGPRLERVIQIIHEGVPEIRDSTEEIELEIDSLPAPVLTKLYNYVLRPLRQPTHPKRSRSGKGTGTGGLKRKSMDEEQEAEKIRQLEERMALFETGGNPPAIRRADSEHSTDSSSSDDSESDSE